MYLNQFTRDNDNDFIADAAKWDKIVTLAGPPASDPKLPIFAAVDAGIKRDSTGIVAVSIEHDIVSLVYHAVYLPQPDAPLDIESTIEKTLIDLSKRFFLRVCVFDQHQMLSSSQRLRRLGLRLEEFKMVPSNIAAMSQNLFDLIRTQRLRVYPTKVLRDAVLNTVAKEHAGALHITKDRSSGKQTDIVVALAMAAFTATQHQSIPLSHRYRAFAADFRDEDLPPLPEPEHGPPGAGADWWRGRPQDQQFPRRTTACVIFTDRLTPLFAGVPFDEVATKQQNTRSTAT
jgi:hypothetical protein